MERWGSVALLLAGVAGALKPPRRLPQWVVPVACAAIALLGGVTSGPAASVALHPLVQPVAFLASAVPLAVMLDELGFFEAVSSRVTRRGGGPGSLWVLAAIVTTVLNLDAGVVLLTPLYVRIARRRGWDPLILAAQPVLLACLASSALPVSNLTNLIAVSWSGASTAQFVYHLALPSLVASVVGWLFYRARFVKRALTVEREPATALAGCSPYPRVARTSAPGEGGRNISGETIEPDPEPLSPSSERTALGFGGGLVVCVLVGFVAGPFVGISPWVVALAADVVLAGASWWRMRSEQRSGMPGSARGAVPWRSVPAGTAVMVFALGVLATAVARYVPTGALSRGDSVADLARETGVAAAGANVVNNLPALLVALPKLGHRSTPDLWAVLLGVNMGPVLLVTGSLASLLWMAALRRLAVKVSPWDFTRFGVAAGLPAAICALGASLGLRALGLS